MTQRSRGRDLLKKEIHFSVMAFPDLNSYSRACAYAHSTQRNQGITSMELMCEASMNPPWSCMEPTWFWMKRTWFKVKVETLSSPSSENVAPPLSKSLSGKAHTFCTYRIYKHLSKLFSMLALVVKSPLRPGKGAGRWAPIEDLTRGPPQFSHKQGCSSPLSLWY